MLNRNRLAKINYNILYCFAIFFLAQLIYAMLHLGYGTSFYPALTQVGTDGAVLPYVKQNFWQSMWYFHLLPPLYIIYSFGFYILFPPEGQIGIYLLHSLLGLAAVYSLYAIQNRFNVSRKLNLALITLFVLSPAFNLYQTMGWYDFPCACLLIISTWALIRFADRPTFKKGLLFFSTIAFLCSIRSMYHIVLYFVPVILITLIAFRKHYKLVLLSAALPFLLVFGMYAKNYYLFHTFSVSSYSGENISMITMQWNFPLKYRYDGMQRGFFSDLALCPQSADTIPMKPDNFAFTGYYCYDVVAQKYRDSYIKKLGTTYPNVAILQPIPGQVAPHRLQLGNIGMSVEYGKNALQALLHYPQVYLNNYQETWRLYFGDPVSYFYENMGNVRKLPTWLPYRASSKGIWALMFFFPFLMYFSLTLILFSKRLVSKLMIAYLGVTVPMLLFYLLKGMSARSQYHLIKHSLWFMLAMMFGSLLYFVYAHIKSKSDQRYLEKITSMFDYTQRLAILFIMCNIAVSSFIMTAFAGNEQQRYRFYVNGLYLLLFSIFLQVIVLPLVRKWKTSLR